MKIFGTFALLLGLAFFIVTVFAYSELRTAATSATTPSADSMLLAKIVGPELFDPDHAEPAPPIATVRHAQSEMDLPQIAMSSPVLSQVAKRSALLYENQNEAEVLELLKKNLLVEKLKQREVYRLSSSQTSGVNACATLVIWLDVLNKGIKGAPGPTAEELESLEQAMKKDSHDRTEIQAKYYRLKDKLGPAESDAPESSELQTLETQIKRLETRIRENGTFIATAAMKTKQREMRTFEILEFPKFTAASDDEIARYKTLREKSGADLPDLKLD